MQKQKRKQRLSLDLLFFLPLSSLNEMKPCVLCTKEIKEGELTDWTGDAHLECAISLFEGCEDESGLFLYCEQCWKPCPYRQMMPVDIEEYEQRLGEFNACSKA